MELGFIIRFLVLTFFVSGVIIFFLYRTLIHGTESAVNRLEEDINAAKMKQNELSRKLKEADEELTKRRVEAQAVADTLRTEAEDEARTQREKIVGKAREDGEEIIEKAKMSAEKLHKELEKEMDIKGVNFGMELLGAVLNDKARGALHEVLVDDFISGLSNVDTSNISSDVVSIDLVSLNGVSDSAKKKIESILSEKLGRKLSITETKDPQMGGGVMIKFGTMALDGSLRTLIREKAVMKQQAVEEKIY